MGKINTLSLFCGAGGLDMGFLDAGFDIRLAIDLSAAAIRTHKKNFAEGNAQQHDLLELGCSGVLELCKKNIPTGAALGIIGGPPCQGFSLGNIGSKADDPRNKLALLYAEIIGELSSSYDVRFVVFENVLGIKSKKHAGTYSSIIDNISSLGFDVFENELNANDFNVAQNRKRVIIVALKKGKYLSEPIFVKSQNKPVVSDVISELEEPAFYKKGLNKEDIPVHPNHWTMRPRSEKFSNPELMDGKKRSFRTIAWDKPSPTIAFGNREIYIHPNKKRRLSIFESMLLQGFPENFTIEGTLSEQVTQVSNAVPPPMAFNIAKAIKNVLKGY
jgi:DNA (cytosine-5)-methyltransferase 1